MNVVTRGKGSPSPGQSLVELALVLMLLFLILAGLVDLGRALNAYIVVTNAAREGARYGSLHVTDPDLAAGIRARVINEAAGSGIDLSDGAISTTEFSASGAGQPVTVSVTYQLSLIFVGLITGGSSVQVSSSVAMIAF